MSSQRMRKNIAFSAKNADIFEVLSAMQTENKNISGISFYGYDRSFAFPYLHSFPPDSLFARDGFAFRMDNRKSSEF